MKKNHLKLVITIVITFLAAGAVHVLKTMEPMKNEKLFLFPLSIGDWQGRDIHMPDWAYRGLETPYVFLRDYTSPREKLPVNLSLVWFDDTNYAFHAPESCMDSYMRKRGKTTIRIGNLGNHEVVKMIVEIDREKYVLLYFFDMDGFITTKQSVIRIQSLLRRLHFKRASATFVRVMVPIEGNEAEAMRVSATFLNDIYKVLPEYTYTDNVKAGSKQEF